MSQPVIHRTHIYEARAILDELEELLLSPPKDQQTAIDPRKSKVFTFREQLKSGTPISSDEIQDGLDCRELLDAKCLVRWGVLCKNKADTSCQSETHLHSQDQSLAPND
jgi:hypothetical protein